MIAALHGIAGGERMAAAEAADYRAWRSRRMSDADTQIWLQIDLGESRRIDAVKLYPERTHLLAGNGFPLRFRIECSEDAGFQAAELIACHAATDHPDPEDHVVSFRTAAQGRYLRLTATRLRPEKLPQLYALMPAALVEAARAAVASSHRLILARIGIISAGEDLATECAVTIGPDPGDADDARQLTRPERPQGEGIVTDNFGNLTDPRDWNPRKDLASADSAAVRLKPGPFLSALEANIAYLLGSSSVDDLLRPFRVRAGLPVGDVPPRSSAFWDGELAGSNAGRFMMGAANTLQWQEHPELRRRLAAVVAGIAECRTADGYVMAYPEDSYFVSERGAYTRAWVTHGLIDAGLAGIAQAFDLLRGYYDWFNTRAFLPAMLRGAGQGGQAMVASTRLYFSPAGRPEDLRVLQRYFQENYWLEDLAAERPEAIWQYPYDRPHVYLLTNLEAYLDLFRATGDPLYWDAVIGGWRLFRAHWQAPGGSFSIIELHENRPDSHPLYEPHGETCGSAFWVLLNHRLHLLDPDCEAYVAEIERSIFNVLLANQAGARGIRYHSNLVGRKEPPTCVNKCCEGQGTRLLARLPLYLYSTGPDALYVNLYQPSSIRLASPAGELVLDMETGVPATPEVRLTVSAAQPALLSLHLRIPAWVDRPVPIRVNGAEVGVGTPGSYFVHQREWQDGDVVDYALAARFRLEPYQGVDQIGGRDRFALHFGPLLMAASGAADAPVIVRFAETPADLVDQLQPVAGKPLHFTMAPPFDEIEFLPYYEVDDECFSCVPIIETLESIV